MKKILFFASALAGLFLAASCQRESLEPEVSGNVVSYTIQVPGALSTKVIGENVSAVNELVYEVYRTEATAADDYTQTETKLFRKTAVIKDGTATVDFELVNNQNFRVLFWAHVNTQENPSVYTTENLKNVTLSQSLTANAESYAAFAGSDFIKYGDNINGRTVTLVRPIAQLNIATAPGSLDLEGQTTVKMTTTGVTVTGLSTSYNVAQALAGDVATTPFTYTAAAVSGPSGLSEQELSVNGTAYNYVAMNYVGFAEQSGSNVEVSYTINTENVGTISNTIKNVPVKANYRTNIVGNLITSMSDYTITLDKEWAGVAEEVEIITDGLVLMHATGVYNISNVNGLAYASQNLFAQEGGSYVLTEDIDMAGASSVVTKAAEGYAYNSAALTHKMTSGKSFEFDGAGHTIKNLPGMFIAYTGSAKSVVVKNLTLETPNVAYDVEDIPETNGVGAFIGYAGTSTTITLENCHVKGGKIEGGHWTGGLVGYAAGYSGNDGPVFETLTIKDCSVKNAEITGKGSCGGIIGHATGDAWTLVDMDNVAVAFNKIISTGSSDNKAGSVMGTLGNAGQPKTVNGVTKTGGVTIDNYEVSVNDVKSNNVVNTKLWGRQGNSDGVLTINGEKVTDFNEEIVTANAVTVSNDEELAKAIAGATGDMVIKLASGTYSSDIKLTVEALGGAKGDLVFKAAEGAEPVIAGTWTFGYRNQGVGNAMWDGNVTFEGITFDHPAAATHSIDVQDVKSLVLRKCKIIGDGEYGLTSARGNGTGTSSIVECTFENAGMQLLGNFATGLVIDGCTFNESCVNVQAGNGVTVQNCNFTNTLTSANVNDSFYLIRSNSTPITVKNCTIAIDSELAEVVITEQAKWYILANRGTTDWTVENVAVTMTDAALMQTELKVTACTSTGKINTTNLTVNGKAYASTSEQLKSAIANANGETTISLKDGSYTFPDLVNIQGKELTFVGSEDAVIDVSNIDARNQFVTGATLKFEGVTLNFGKVNYMGFANTASLTYKDCNINGLQFLFGENVVFEGCSLNSNGAEHTVWTYGVKNVSFTGCDFTYGDRGVNCYSDNDVPGGQTVNFTNCTFATENTASDGAVEINSCFISEGIVVNMEGCTAPAYGEMAYVSPWDSTNGAKTTINIK